MDKIINTDCPFEPSNIFNDTSNVKIQIDVKNKLKLPNNIVCLRKKRG